MGSKRLEKILTRCFFRYGHLVGNYPKLFGLLPVIFTVILAPCMFLMKYDDNVILLFTPYDAPSRQELTVYNNFALVQPLAEPHGHNHSNITSSKVKTPLLQTAKNDPMSNPWVFIEFWYVNQSNIMTSETWAKIGQTIDYIYNNFTCQVRSGSKLKTMRYNPDFCDPKNPSGQCIPWPKYIRTVQSILNRTEQGDSKIELTYPVIHLWNLAVNWGQFLYGAEVNRSNNQLISARVLALKMGFQFSLIDEGESEAKQCLKQLQLYVYSQSLPNEYTFSFNSEWHQNAEVTGIMDDLLPFISLTVVLVTIFIAVSSYYARAPVMGIVEAFLGILTIGLSLLTALALLFACGVQFNFVTVIMPFLVLCVGIDNDFLLTSAWRCPKIESMATTRRLAHAFVDAGPSLTITSINDILCFAVGACLTESPAIADFCLFTCVALGLRFVYQLTFFAGALVYMNQRNWNESRIFQTFRNLTRKWKKNGCNQKSVPPSQNGLSQESDCNNQQGVARGFSPERRIQKFLSIHYSPVLAKRSFRVLMTALFVIYLAMATFGATKLGVNISLKKLVYDNSPMQEYFEITEKYTMKTQIGSVIITRAPDFRQPREIDRFLEFVDALEGISTSLADPKETTSLWLRDYIDFRSYIDSNSEADFYEYLTEFLHANENRIFIGDLRFSYSANRQLNLDSFRFTVYYSDIETYDDSARVLLLWRSICGNYSDYGAIVQDYFYRNTYLDQRLTLAGTTLQTMGIASLMIAFVTSLLMPDVASMFFICFSSLSVDLGVIAALNAWGSNLDPVTMACLLMTIGFSIYYTARMCYCYQRSIEHGADTMIQKLAYTFETIGWPILQGGLGTLVGSIPLLCVSAYIVRTFFRTILLVVIIGLMHGLVFIPVMMSLYDLQIPPFRKYRLGERQKILRSLNCLC